MSNNLQTAQDTIESIVKEAYDLVGKNSQSEKSNGKTNKGLNNQAVNGQSVYLNNVNQGANSNVSKSNSGYLNVLQQKNNANVNGNLASNNNVDNNKSGLQNLLSDGVSGAISSFVGNSNSDSVSVFGSPASKLGLTDLSQDTSLFGASKNVTKKFVK